MHPAVEGFIIGLALAFVLVGAEYLLQRKAARERSEQFKTKIALDDTQRRRINSLLRFSLSIPLGFAAAYWLIG